MGRKPRGVEFRYGYPDVDLVTWRPSTTATPPIELRRPFTGRLLTLVATTAIGVVVLSRFVDPLGPLLLAVLVVACGLCGVLWVLYSSAVESLILQERVLIQRRWWGALQRTRLEDVATVVYLPKYGHQNREGWEYRPYLVLLDAEGHRLHKLMCANWSEPQLETLAALTPAATKLKVPGRIDPRSLRKFDRSYAGIRRRR